MDEFTERMAKKMTAVQGVKKKTIDLHDNDGVHYTATVSTNEKIYGWKDSVSFWKMYDGFLEVFIELSNNAKRFLLLLMKEGSPNRDTIRLDLKTYLEKTGGSSRSPYYSAVRELVKAEIICVKETYVFQINPCFIFNGDRTKLLGSAEEAFKEQQAANNGKIKR